MAFWASFAKTFMDFCTLCSLIRRMSYMLKWLTFLASWPCLQISSGRRQLALAGWAAQPKARRAADWPSRQAGRPTNGHYDYVHGARTWICLVASNFFVQFETWLDYENFCWQRIDPWSSTIWKSLQGTTYSYIIPWSQVSRAGWSLIES